MYVDANPLNSVDPLGLYTGTDSITNACAQNPFYCALLGGSALQGAQSQMNSHQNSDSNDDSLECPKDRRNACLAALIECIASGSDQSRCDTAFELCVRNPGSTVKYPDGTKVRPDGTIITPDGRIRRPDGSELGP